MPARGLLSRLLGLLGRGAAVAAPTSEEVERYGRPPVDPRAAPYAGLLDVWGGMARPETEYHLALYDDRESSRYQLWLERAEEEWMDGRVLAFTREEHLQHYVGIVCRDRGHDPGDFSSWTAKYGEIALVVSRISGEYVKRGGRGIRVDLCGVDAGGNVVTADVLWDNMSA